MKRRLAAIGFVALAAAFAGGAYAEPGGTWTIKALWERALTNDPEQSLAKAVDASALARIKLAEAELAPRYKAGASASVAGESSSGLDYAYSVAGEVGVSIPLGGGGSLSAGLSAPLAAQYASGAELSSFSPALSASVELPIFANGRPLDGRIGAANKALASGLPRSEADAAYRAKRASLLFATAGDATQAAAAAESLACADLDIAAREKRVELARITYRLGKIPFSDLAKAERELTEQKLGRMNAVAAESRARGALARRIGARPEELAAFSLAVLPRGLPRPKPEEVAKASSAAARRELDRALASRVLSGARVAPSLSLSGSAALAAATSKDPGFFPQASLSLRIPLGADARLSAESSEAALAVSRLALLAAEAEALASLAASDRAVAYAEAKAAVGRDAEKAARENLALVELGLSVGTAIALEAEEAEVALERALAALRAADRALFMAELERAALGDVDPLALAEKWSGE